MKRDRIKIYILEIILLIFLIYTLFSKTFLSNKILLSSILIIYSIIVGFVVKKKNQLKINKKSVTRMMIVLGIIYIAIYYMVGIYAGYYKATHKFGLFTLEKYILPLTLFIISGEFLRSKFLTGDTKLSNLFNFIIGVLIDCVVYFNVYEIKTLDEFLLSIGYILFASIACNLLYNYICKRYGIKPVIYYRLITTMYLYIIPITPDVYILFKTFFRMLYPVIIYYILDDGYAEKEMDTTAKNDMISNTIYVVLIILMALYIGLISCKFKYGALVIGSGSMRKTIYKGDVVIFHNKIDCAKLKKNDIIVFDKNNIRLVHRIVNISQINNKKIYYTKGDNNQSMDEGYIVDENIIGLVKFKIPYVGLPTIYLHEMFEKN